MLCGIEPISINGEETDFLSYLFSSDDVERAFKASALLATILLVIFSVFMILRTIAKDKAEGTPAQIAVKAFKTLVMFFLVPMVMIAFMAIGNAFVKALYEATRQNSGSLGSFMFSMFAEDGGMAADKANLFKTGELSYNNVGHVTNHMNLSDFPFFFSFIAGLIVLFGVGSAMLIFVDRVLSLVILYIAAPISISTSVLDDGARFKLWRDQFLSKFIMGYGMILAINIYAMVCGLVMGPSVQFFEGNTFLNMLMKLLIIGGGAFTMQKSMALVGNLVSSGMGSNELRDNAFSMGGLARMAQKGAGMAFGAATAPLRPVKSILGDAASMKSRDWGSQLLDKIGLGVGDSSGKKGGKDSESKSGATNNEKPDYGSKDSAKNAIKDEGFKTSFSGGGGNANNSSSKKDGGNAVSNAIQNIGGMKNDQKPTGGSNK
jgi:hypothetical protein